MVITENIITTSFVKYLYSSILKKWNKGKPNFQAKLRISIFTQLLFDIKFNSKMDKVPTKFIYKYKELKN